jgi:hypothetical protein
MQKPDVVECATCGAVAQRVTWGATACTCYRCTECHAGGHIAPDGVRQGGVFEELRNVPTRELDDDRVVADGGIEVTEHAADRWDQRTPVDSVAPETAWKHAQRHSDATARLAGDEARIHHPTESILIRDRGRICTVLAKPLADDVLEEIVDDVLAHSTAPDRGETA